MTLELPSLLRREGALRSEKQDPIAAVKKVPAIAVNVEEVLRGEGVGEDGDDEGDLDGLARLLLLQDEVLLVHELLVAIIHNPKPEGLRAAVKAVLPDEVSADSERDADNGASDRRDLRLHFETRQRLRRLANRFASLDTLMEETCNV